MSETSQLRWGFAALARLAWPVVLSRSAQAVIGFSDALMTAPLGEDALAATTAGSMNTLSVAILPMGTAFIVQSFASQLAGKGDLLGARRYGWYGLFLAGLAGLLYALAIPAVRPALEWLHYAPNVRSSMADYIEIRLWSVAAIVGVEAVGNWYAGLGNTRYQMIASIVTMVFNVALNWMLIEGHWGAPAMGVRGAAIASLISTAIGMLLLTTLFVRRVGFRPQPAEAGASSKLRWSEFGRMLRFGAPSGLNWFLEFAAFMFFVNVVVADLGTVATAAVLAVIQVNSVSFMPAFGLSSAGAILVGQAIGADRRDDVPAILKRTLLMTCCWQVSVGVAYVLFPGPIMGLFAPRTQVDGLPSIVEVGATALALSAAWQLFDAVTMSVSETLRAAGDTAFSLYARLAVAWLLFVPSSYLVIAVFDAGVEAAILAVVGYLAVLSVVMGWRFRRGAWRTIELTEPS